MLPHLRPHLLHVLQHHIAVPIERLNAPEQLVVVAAIDQHLRAWAADVAAAPAAAAA